MIIKEQLLIDFLEEERTIHIYIPDNIENNEKLPVIYMFDGHNLFYDADATYGKAWGIKKYLDKVCGKIIVVGIECNHVGNLRLCEFSPYDFNDSTWGEVKACGESFFQWMINTLKPYIDTHYPTLTDRTHTAIGGSSMGGLMAIYGGSVHADIFSKAACLSPYHEHIMYDLLNDIKNIKTLSKSTFYISWGSLEWYTKRTLSIGIENNLKITRELIKKGATVYPHSYVNGHHRESSWEKEVPIFLEELKLVKNTKKKKNKTRKSKGVTY